MIKSRSFIDAHRASSQPEVSLPAIDDLVLFSPLPPQPNGIADYCFELLTGFKSEFQCTVVVADGAGGARAPAGVTVISESEYIRREALFRRMLHVYQVGNNPDHIYMLPYITERPGLLVLHDPSLHHLLSCASADVGDFSRYTNALEAEHGAAGRVLGEQFRQYKLRETSMFYDMPMIRGLVGPSLGTIVHSRFAQAKVLARVPDATVTVVPHQYLPLDLSRIDTPESVRQRFGLGDNDILFASFGFVTRSKRLDLVLRSLAAIRDRLPPFKYVIAGELKPLEVDIPALVSELGLTDCVTTTDYVEERDFSALVRAADVVVNLRHPIGGETSGTMIRALGAGACVVVVDRGPFAEIPDGAAIRLTWDRTFPQRLADALLTLAKDRDLRRRVGLSASRYTAVNNSIHATIRGYQKAVQQATKRAVPQWACEVVWEFLSPQALTRINILAANADRDLPLPCWFIAGVMPVSSSRIQALWIGDAREISLLSNLGYPDGAVQVLASPSQAALAAQAPRSFDWILFRFGGRPSDFAILDKHIAALNRLLAFGGLLILHSVVGHVDYQMPLIRSAISRITASHGFHLDAYVTGGVSGIFGPPGASTTADEQEERCWRLSKISETFGSETGQHYADLHNPVLLDNR
jgi:glycosyltransferase involved in cell wall biosynthesis